MGKQIIPNGCYYLHDRIMSNGEQKIYIRYFVRGKYVKKNTGICVLEKNWDQKAQAILGGSQDIQQKNKFLKVFKHKIDQQLLEYTKEITPPVIQRLLNNQPADIAKAGAQTLLIPYCRDYNKRRYETGHITYHTYENKESHISVFEKFLKIRKLPHAHLNDVDVELIDEFFKFRKEILDNHSHKAINKSVVPIYQALDEAAKKGLVSREDIYELTSHFLPEKSNSHAVREKEDVKWLTQEQINNLIEYHEQCTRWKTREYIELWLFSYFAAGLRFIDLMLLKWEDIDFSDNTIKKVQYKTGNKVYIPLNDKAVNILEKWRKHTNGNPYVFRLIPANFNIDDERTTNHVKNSLNKTINISLHTSGKKSGLPFNLTMHMARHSFAVHAINSGMNLKVISKLMGHSSIVVTEKVYAEILNNTLSKEYGKSIKFYSEIQDIS